MENTNKGKGINDIKANVSCIIPKKHNHDHFWIEDNVLYESYNTIKGLRYLPIKEVHGMPDVEKCDESCIKYISKKYYS